MGFGATLNFRVTLNYKCWKLFRATLSWRFSSFLIEKINILLSSHVFFACSTASVFLCPWLLVRNSVSMTTVRAAPKNQQILFAMKHEGGLKHRRHRTSEEYVRRQQNVFVLSLRTQSYWARTAVREVASSERVGDDVPGVMAYHLFWSGGTGVSYCAF